MMAKNPSESLSLQEGFRGLQCSLRGVYTDGIFTRVQFRQISPVLSEVEWKVTVTVHTCVPVPGIRSSYPARGQAQVIWGLCRSQPSPSNQEGPTTRWKETSELGSKMCCNDLMEEEPRKMDTWCPFSNNGLFVWARQNPACVLVLTYDRSSLPCAWKCLTRATQMSVMPISDIGLWWVISKPHVFGLAVSSWVAISAGSKI